MKRLHYKADLTKANVKQDREPCEEDEANLISSESANRVWRDLGFHLPVIDLDFPAKLVPSTTKGHFHLYLDKLVPWDKYVALLAAMVDAGLVEPGYLDCTIKRGASFVRKPGVKKQPGDVNSASALSWAAPSVLG